MTFCADQVVADADAWRRHEFRPWLLPEPELRKWLIEDFLPANEAKADGSGARNKLN